MTQVALRAADEVIAHVGRPRFPLTGPEVASQNAVCGVHVNEPGGASVLRELAIDPSVQTEQDLPAPERAVLSLFRRPDESFERSAPLR
ncbi:hypothetical protein SSPO_007530 [Streptomyces antimycoticus]|uniref:Uncharacterized protein n=1 Tax=Streptomyces antimycoticus TaxID=68175 RepID=A0A499UB05_9ACTN|nr:hypothetical protein SSPO_007530 [Streptomyces antimycoticus]